MGFTRYWTIKKTIPHDKWDSFLKYANSIIEYSISDGIPLGDGSGEGSPEIDKDSIELNGVDEDSYESFSFKRVRKGNGWEFCKTAHKPYDRVVYELLYLASIVLGEEYLECDTFNNEESDDIKIKKILLRDFKIDGLLEKSNKLL